MSNTEDAVSVSSSDDSFDDHMFVRASEANSAATYRGTVVLPACMDRKTVLVTGGAGFVGSHTAGKSLLGCMSHRGSLKLAHIQTNPLSPPSPSFPLPLPHDQTLSSPVATPWS